MSDKRCPRCEQVKPRAEFGGRSYCRPCKAAIERARRRDNVTIRPEVIARFWSRVNKNGPVFKDKGPCWVWQGAPRNAKGYGQFHIGGRNLSPHTVMFMLTRGIKGSREVFVDHMCRNTMCLNPDHLRFVTPRINAVENNDSPHARNAQKTHCTPGHHPLSGDNLIVATVQGQKRRFCVACYLKRRPTAKTIYGVPIPASHSSWSSNKGEGDVR